MLVGVRPVILCTDVTPLYLSSAPASAVVVTGIYPQTNGHISFVDLNKKEASAGPSGTSTVATDGETDAGADDEEVGVDPIPGVTSFHWTRRFWRQGPRATKLNNISTVDPELLSEIVITVHRQMVDIAAAISTALTGSAGDSAVSGNESESELQTKIITAGNRWIDTWNELLYKEINLCLTTSVSNFHLHQGTNIHSNTTDTDSVFDKASARVEPIEFELHIFHVRNINYHQPRPSASASNDTATAAAKSVFLEVMGEITFKNPSDIHVLESMVNLSVCLVSVLARSAPWCTPIHTLNYYAHINLIIHESYSQIFLLHFWLQTSSQTRDQNQHFAHSSGDSQGGSALDALGKLTGSDVYIALDTRIDSSAGFSIHTKSIGQQIGFQLPFSKTVDTNQASNSQSNGRNNDSSNDNGLLKASLYISSRFSLQRYTTQLCRKYNLSEMACGHVSLHMSQHAARSIDRAIYASLPAKQLIPSPSHPFVFLHIEKSAGTTLRE